MIIKNLSLDIEMPNTVLGDLRRLIPELTARNLGENARVSSGIRKEFMKGGSESIRVLINNID